MFKQLTALYIGALAGLCLLPHAKAADTLGLDIGSIHSNNYDRVAERNWNDVNPGIYYRHDNVVVGTYYNSIRKQSYYVGYVYALSEHFDVIGGVVSGYNGSGPGGAYTAKAAMPMLVPSFHFGLFGGLVGRVDLLAQVAKGGATAIHFSIERKF